MGEVILEIFGTVTGLLYVWFEIKHSRFMWIVGIVMSVCYIVVFGIESLYASMGLYVYYLGVSVYGWFKWSGNTRLQEKQPVLKPVRITRSTAWLTAGLLITVSAEYGLYSGS